MSGHRGDCSTEQHCYLVPCTVSRCTRMAPLVYYTRRRALSFIVPRDNVINVVVVVARPGEPGEPGENAFPARKFERRRGTLASGRGRSRGFSFLLRSVEATRAHRGNSCSRRTGFTPEAPRRAHRALRPKNVGPTRVIREIRAPSRIILSHVS